MAAAPRDDIRLGHPHSLDMAVDDRGFVPVAIFGAENCRRTLVTGVDAARALAESYRGR